MYISTMESLTKDHFDSQGGIIGGKLFILLAAIALLLYE